MYSELFVIVVFVAIAAANAAAHIFDKNCAIANLLLFLFLLLRGKLISIPTNGSIVFTTRKPFFIFCFFRV